MPEGQDEHEVIPFGPLLSALLDRIQADANREAQQAATLGIRERGIDPKRVQADLQARVFVVAPESEE